MNYLKVKNVKIIKRVYKDELKRVLYKSIYYNTKLSPKVRQAAFFKLVALKKQSSVSFLKARCIWTNNSRAVMHFFKLARFSFRMHAAYGYLPGIRKSSW